MKALLIFLLVVAVASAQFPNGLFGNAAKKLGERFQKRVERITTKLKSLPLLSNVHNFAEFLAQTGKKYKSAAEQKLHERLFREHKSLVESNNDAFSSGRKRYELVLNAFADLTKQEFLKKLTGIRKSKRGESKARTHRRMAKPPKVEKIPDSFDWRERGAVTPVKFQDECGSCWSFAVTGAIEGHVFRKTGRLPNLSEQNLVDCGKEEFGLLGCDGGYQEYGFEFIADQQKGIAKGEKYPYLAQVEACRYTQSINDAGTNVTGFAVIPPKNEETMKKVIATLGPLACSVNALESLMLYKQGIYADDECNKGEVNHAILVVGYGSENGADYWIVKNSWDKVWGEEGYFRLPRGYNFCGIALECSYPLIANSTEV